MTMDRGRLAIEIRRARGGFIALLALGLLALGAAAVIANGLRLNMPWASTYTAHVAVDDAKGVVPGKQQVRISGFPVGKITKAQLVDGHPVLTIQIKGRYAPLYHDASLRLRPKTPLDDLYLNVETRGHAAAGKLTSSETLPAERTRAPVDIGRVLDTFGTDTRVRMKQAIDALGSGLGDHGAEFRATLVKLAPFLQAAKRLTQATAARGAATQRLVHNFRLMVEELGRRSTQLKTLVRSGAQTFTELARADAPLSQVINEFPPLLRQLIPAFAALRASADELDPAFDKLQPSARALPAGLAALRSFSLEARPSLQALRKPLPDLTALVSALAPTASGLERAFTRLGPTAPRLDRITAAVVPCELAVQKFFHNTLSLMKFYDARGLVARGQTVDGASPNQRADTSCAAGGPQK
jgi:virulence factor Mce-like protein